MTEALPHPLDVHQPAIKPTFPGSMVELEITPEKARNKECKNPSRRGHRKKVAFSEELNRVYIDGRIEHKQNQCHQYTSLSDPKLNSTYGVTHQMEKLKLERNALDKQHEITLEPDVLQSVNDRAAAALNFKRDERHFEDLISVDVDKERELSRMAVKRSAYEKGKVFNNGEEEDIMTFWTDDLLTDNPRLDYDRINSESILEPDTSIDNLDFLADMYYCKEVASRFT